MSTIINKAYYNLSGTYQEDLSSLVKVSGGSNLTSQLQAISPQPNDFNCQITITNEFGKNVGWLSATYLETEDIESGTYSGETWQKWYYNVQQSVLAEVSRLNASKLYFQFRWREEDSNYQSAVTATVDFDDVGYEATIDAQLEAILTATGNTDKWFLVTDTSGDVRSFTSDGTDWNDDGFEKPIYPNVYTSELKEIPVTPTIVASESSLTNSELVIINAWLTSLSSDVADLQDEDVLNMKIADYDTDGTATDSVKYARNIGTDAGGSITYAEQLAKNNLLDQSVKTTDDVEFNSITVSAGVDATGSPVSANSVDAQQFEVYDATSGKTLAIIYDGENADGNALKIIYPASDGSVELAVGQESWIHGYNNSGVNISDGDPVAIVGSQGNRPTIQLATTTDDDIAHKTIGVATQDIDNGDYGKVTTFGLVRGLSIGTGFSEGDFVYLDDGVYTSTRPTAPTPVVELGVVLKVTGGAINTLFVNVDKLHKLSSLSDVEITSITNGDVLQWDGTKFVNENLTTLLDNQKFVKTGWPFGYEDKLNIAFDDATRTFTLSATEDVDFYIQNTKFTLENATPRTVTITDTEGLWFFYINSSDVLTASQTAWAIEDDNKALVSYGYWNATDNEMIILGYECHTYNMPASVHRDLHNGIGTVLRSGGVVSDSGSDTLNCTAPILLDEDIKITVSDDDVWDSKFDQQLTPLKSYKYYRDGASGLLKRVDDSTTPFYLVGNKVQLNPYSGGTYSLVDMTNNKYGAYWVVHTNDITNPVKIFLGQAEADSLDNAIEDNGLASMNFGSLPLQEQVIAYRIIVKQEVASPYYSIEQIDDFTVDRNIGTPASAPTSHGALSGLLEDDHTQYYNSSRLASATELDVRYYTETELDGGKLDTRYYTETETDNLLDDKVDKDLSSDVDYPPQTASTVADEDLAYVYLYDNGALQKMSLTEIYAGANTATGSFVASTDYAGDGLGAFKSATLTIHQALLNANAQVYIDIKTVEDDQIYYIQMPTIASTNDLELSVDNQTTYKDVLGGTSNISGADVSDKLLALYYDGTQFKLLETNGVEAYIPYAGEVGTYGTSKDSLPVAVKGHNVLDVEDYRGMTLEQRFANPNLDSTTGYSSAGASNSVTSSILSNTGDGTSANPALFSDLYSFTASQKYFIKLRVRVTSALTNNILVKILGGGNDVTVVSQSSPVQNQWYELSTIATASTTASSRLYIYHQYSSSANANGQVLQADYIQVIPVPTDITTATQMNSLLDGQVLSQDIHSVGDIQSLDQLLDNRNEFSKWTFTEAGTSTATIDTTTQQNEIPYIKFTSDGTNLVYGDSSSLTDGSSVYTILTHIIKNTASASKFFIASGTYWNGTTYASVGETGIVKTKKTSILAGHRAGLLGDTNAEVIFRQAILEGDWTHLTDEQALDIIQNQEYGAFELQGVWLKSVGKNKFDKSNVLGGYTLATDGTLSSSSLRVTSEDYIRVIGGQAYTFSYNGTATGTPFFIVCEYDNEKSLIARSATVTSNITLQSGTKFVRFTYYDSGASVDYSAFTDFQLELGTSATTYEAYISSNAHIDGVLRGIGVVKDTLDTQRFARDYNDVVQSATTWSIDQVLTNTHCFFKNLESILGYKTPSSNLTTANLKLRIGSDIYTVVDATSNVTNDNEKEISINTSDNFRIRVNKTTYPNTASFEAYLQANDVEFIYELDEYIPRTEENNNLIPITGALWSEAKGTYTQVSNGVINTFYTTQPLDLEAQVKQNVFTDLIQGKDIKQAQQDIDYLQRDMETAKNDIGITSDLDTTATDLVEAVNEVHGELNDVVDGTTEVAYDNSFSGLTAVTLKEGLDELSLLTGSEGTITFGLNCSDGGNTEVNSHEYFVIGLLDVDHSANIGSGSVIATLPSGYRPATTIGFVGYDDIAGTNVNIVIQSGGSVLTLDALSGTTGNVTIAFSFPL